MDRNLRRGMLIVGILSVLSIGKICEAEEESKNLLINPGFETTNPYVVPEDWEKRGLLVESKELPKGYDLNPLWKDIKSKVTVVYDPETSHGGMKYIRLEGQIALYDIGFPECKWGKKYIFSVWAKGSGKLESCLYLYNRDGAQVLGNPSIKQEYGISSKEWKEYKWELTMPEEGRDPQSTVVSFRAAYHIEGTIDLDDGCLYFAEDNPILQ